MQLNERHQQGRAGEVTAPEWLCLSEIYSGDGQKRDSVPSVVCSREHLLARAEWKDAHCARSWLQDGPVPMALSHAQQDHRAAPAYLS